MTLSQISRSTVFACIQVLEDERRRLREYLETTPEDDPGYADYQLLEIDYDLAAAELRDLYEQMTTANSNDMPYDSLVMVLAYSWDLRRRPGEVPVSLRPAIGLDGVVPEHVTYPAQNLPGASSPKWPGP